MNEQIHGSSDAHEEGLMEKVSDLFNNAVGLPSGKFPDGRSKSPARDNSPRGTLTSDDAEGTPPQNGTGIAPRD